jgi:hypothetical protein
MATAIVSGALYKFSPTSTDPLVKRGKESFPNFPSDREWKSMIEGDERTANAGPHCVHAVEELAVPTSKMRAFLNRG